MSVYETELSNITISIYVNEFYIWVNDNNIIFNWTQNSYTYISNVIPIKYFN